MTTEQQVVRDVLLAALQWDGTQGDIGNLCALSEAANTLRKMLTFSATLQHEHPWEWVTATWADVHAGDKVRAPGVPDSDDVATSVHLWSGHVDPASNPRYPRPLEHQEVIVVLERHGRRHMRPDAAVEVWRPAPVSDEHLQRALLSLAEGFDIEVLR